MTTIAQTIYDATKETDSHYDDTMMANHLALNVCEGELDHEIRVWTFKDGSQLVIEDKKVKVL